MLGRLRSTRLSENGGLTYGDEEVGNSLLILGPGRAVLPAAAGDVSRRSVGNHTAEEDGVEPGEGAPALTVNIVF